MPNPYTDTDLLAAYRAGAFDDLPLSGLAAPGECACQARAYERASRRGDVEYGQVFPDEVRCSERDRWCEGRIVMSCTNGRALFDALSDAGYGAEAGAMDAELWRRMEAWQRASDAQAKVLAFARDALDLPAPDTIEAELHASRILLDAGHSPAAVAAAGRALRSTTK